MLNVVTEVKDFSAAVLLQAIEPLEGIEEMRHLCGRKDLRLIGKGPACLKQALGITRAENGLDLCAHDSGLCIEPRQAIPKRKVAVSPRIGLGKTPEPWLSKPWGYSVAGRPFVSRLRTDPAGVPSTPLKYRTHQFLRMLTGQFIRFFHTRGGQPVCDQAVQL